jgi:hypothetical protein
MASEHFKNISTGSEPMTGIVRLEPNLFQNVSIPVKGKTIKYFLDKVAAVYGGDVSDIITLCKALPASDGTGGMWQIYAPGVSGTASEFQLVVTDNGVDEINPFLVLTKNFAGTIDVDWNSSDGGQ